VLIGLMQWGDRYVADAGGGPVVHPIQRRSDNGTHAEPAVVGDASYWEAVATSA